MSCKLTSDADGEWAPEPTFGKINKAKKGLLAPTRLLGGDYSDGVSSCVAGSKWPVSAWTALGHDP